MKIKLLTIIGIASVQSVFAQEFKNHVSINPFNASFGTVQLQYERGINKNMTLGTAIGGKTYKGVFVVSGFDSPKLKTKDFAFRGVKIIPEFRWYLQNNSMSYSGFYLGSYYKFQNYKSGLKGTYTDSQGMESPVDIDVNLATHVVGLEAGYKLILKKQWFMDFIIAGPGMSFNNVKIEKNQPLVSSFYKDAIKELKNKFDIFDQLDDGVEFDNQGGKTSKANFTLPAFRYGISVGYAF